MSILNVKKRFPFIMSLAFAFGAWAQTPVAPALSTPTNGAVGQGAALTLSWGTVAAAATYTVQVSTGSAFAVLTVNATGLTAASYAATGLTVGIEYYWQVSATSAADSTGPWSTVWSFSTLAAPAAPALTAPANAAANEPTSLTLTWNAAARATSYDAQVSLASTFAATVFDDPGLTGSPAAVTGLNVGTQYFWRVEATNTSGTTSSAIRNFTTAFPAPTLSSPSNGDTGVATPVALTWGTVAGATSYTVQVSTGSGFTAFTVNQAGLTAGTYTTPALPSGTVYYWRANATNGTATSPYSTVDSFATSGTALAAPVLASPTNATAGLGTSLTLSWDTVAGAATYSLEVSTGATFTTLTASQTGLSASSFAISGLTAGTTYYWQVNAAATGCLSPWSTTWHFATLAVPATPTLAAPANAATGEATSLTLSWNSAVRAVTYGMQVSTASTFATTAISQTGLTALSSAVSGLVPGTIYYWEANAGDAAGSSAWSTVRNFTTLIAAPTLISPMNASVHIPLPVTFTWNSVSGASTYTLQISTSANFTSTVMFVTGITGASYSVTSGLAGLTVYAWEVEAVGPAVTSAWSNIGDFELEYTAVHSPVGAVAGIPTFEVRNGVIAYSLQKTGPVEMAVFDLRGRSVFAFNHTQPAGSYSIDLANRSVAPGRYFVWFKSGVFEKRTAIAFTGSR